MFLVPIFTNYMDIYMYLLFKISKQIQPYNKSHQQDSGKS